MGTCNMPGCDEWINSATDVYCCELHRIYHKLDIKKTECEQLYQRLATVEDERDRIKEAIKEFSDKWKYYDSKTITGLDDLRAALREVSSGKD